MSDFADVGFVVLPQYLSADELADGVAALPALFPTRDEFHDNADPERNARFRDEFTGISHLPIGPVEVSLLAVHPRLIELAEQLLGTKDIRLYNAEAWAKYSGAASYEQELHRDYLNHSVIVPTPDSPPTQVEMFVYLSDVTDDLGAPRYVPLEHTRSLSPLPNWLPHEHVRVDDEHPTWVSRELWPELYAHEVSGAGPAGTVVAYRIETFHRGTELTAPRGARYTIHSSFRRADADWIAHRSWIDSVGNGAWEAFVAAASPRQRELFGFPPPGHPYWTERTLADTAVRYPGFNAGPYRR